MEGLDLADPELVLIINITENKFCNDCQKKNPRWCSINNAVLLCASCARKHRKYNKNISTIKSLEGELWTKDEIKKLYIGGNERFNKMLTSYNIPLTNENAEYKYHTKIAGYYRNLLSEELKGKKVIDLVRPSLKEGIELISKEDYDKINQYVPSQDNVIDNNNINNNNNQRNNNSNSDSDNIINIPGLSNIFANPFASDFNNNNNGNNNNNNNNNNIFNNNNYNNNNNNNNIFNNRNNNNNNRNNNYNNERNNNNNNNNNYDEFQQQLSNFAEGVNSVFNNLSQRAQNIDYNEKLRNAGEYLKDKKEKIEQSDTFKGFMSALSTGIETFVRKTENFINESFDNYANNDMPQRNRPNNRNQNQYQNQNQMQFQDQNMNNNNNYSIFNDNDNISNSNNINSNNNNNDSNNNNNDANSQNVNNINNVDYSNFNIKNMNFNIETPMGPNCYIALPKLMENSNVQNN